MTDLLGQFLKTSRLFLGKSKLQGLWLKTRSKNDLRTTVLPGGGKVRCDVGIPYEGMVWLDSEEQEDLNILHSLLKEGEAFIDCGANIGIWSLVAASAVGMKGKIISFEPNPVTYGKFIDNINLNNLAGVIHPHCLAVGSHRKKIGLTNETEHNNCRITSQIGENSIDVTVVTLNDMIDKMPIAGMKIDVEGDEFEVVQGAVDILKTSKPWLCIEFNTVIWKLNRLGDWPVHKYLSELGYSAYKFSEATLGEKALPEGWSTKGYINLYYKFSREEEHF